MHNSDGEVRDVHNSDGEVRDVHNVDHEGWDVHNGDHEGREAVPNGEQQRWERASNPATESTVAQGLP